MIIWNKGTNYHASQGTNITWLTNLLSTAPGRIYYTIQEFEKLNSNFKNAAGLTQINNINLEIYE
jgi:hypothetical protein